MKQKDIKKGLAGLMTPQAATAKNEQPKAENKAPRPEKKTGDYKTFCFSLPVEITERIKDIAYWDRKKINAVVTEAFEQYVKQWDAKNEQ